MNDSPIFLSKLKISEAFDHESRHIFTRTQICKFIEDNSTTWQVDNIPLDSSDGDLDLVLQAKNPTAILQTLLQTTNLQEVKIDFPYRPVYRFTWGEAPTYQLLQTIDGQAFFCHFTTLHLHGLTEQIPKTIYINSEQAGSGGGGELKQENINRAFQGRCRTSNNVATFRGLSVCRINGMNTGQLGVIHFTPENADYDIRVTNVERTLIDSVVRPVYAGGVTEVAKAFQAAAGSVSINKLAAYLRTLNFTYPYHQAIGFYLERAGAYSDSQINLIRQFPIEFDFYLTYQMKNPDYNERWRLFIPKDFQ